MVGWLVSLYFIAYKVLKVIFRHIHFYTNNQFCFKQISLVHSTIVKNISISNYSVYSNSFIQLIQFSISTDFIYTVNTVLYQTIHFSVSRASMSKTVPFQTIQFSISTQFKSKYSLIIKNISISSCSV